MATSGWLGNRVIHSWGSAYSRFESDVYINSIQRNSTNIRVRGTIYLTCRTNGKYCWYTWPIATSANWNQLGNIKPSTGNTYIQNKQWSKSFDITINCSNTATSATLEIRFSDSNMGTKQQNYTLYFDRYASGPSGMTISASYTPYRTITSSCSGINWGQGYSSRKLICDATWTYQGRTETVNLGTWTDGATSKTVTKTDFVFPAENLAVNVKWTAQTNINSISAGKQLTVNKTYPEPNLNNAVVSAESTGPYKVRASISGVDFSYNYSKRVISCYIDYTLDGVSYSNKISEITDGSTSLTVEKDASQETNPWETIPDDNEATIRFVVDNGNGISEKSCSIYCESQYEAYVIGRVPVEEQETNTAEGNLIQITDSDNAPLVDCEILGNTTQQTYTGKNLLNLGPKSDGGVAGAITDGSTVTVTGTALVTDGRAVAELQTTLQAGTYTLTIDHASTHVINFTVNTSNGNVAFRLAAGETSVTKTLASASTDGNVFWAITQGQTYNETFKLQLVTGSTPDYNYEPYVGGVPAPNPDYPQAVQTVTGENVVKICGKNLLDMSRLQQTTINGVTFSYDPTSQTVTLNGTATARAASYFIQSIPLDGSYTLSYRVVGGLISNTTSSTRLEMAKSNSDWSNAIYLRLGNSDSSLTVSRNVPYTVQNIRIDPGVVLDNYQIRVQLEKNSQATDWEAYQEQSYEVNLYGNLYDKSSAVKSAANIALTMAVDANTSYIFDTGRSWTTVHLYDSSNVKTRTLGNASASRKVEFTTAANEVKAQLTFYVGESVDVATYDFTGVEFYKTNEAIELCKIGDYQDYIYKSGDKWYVRKEVGSYTFDGSEAWARSGSTTSTVFVAATGIYLGDYIQVKMGEGSQSLFDRFTFNTQQAGAAGRFNLYNGTDYYQSLAISFDIADIPDITAAKAWLASNTPTLYGVLATPTDTEITNSALIEQLEAVLNSYTYKGITNIMLIPSSAPSGTLDIEYYTKYNDYSQATLLSNGKNGTGQFKQIRRVITK